MKEWVTRLLALQETDLRIRQLHDRLDLLPRELVRIENDLASERGRAEAAREEIKAAELAIRQVEADIKAESDTIQKLQTQSVNIKKNDEYAAMLREIGHHKSQIYQHETRQLEAMEQLDAARNRLKAVEKDLGDKAQTAETEKAEFKELATRLQAEIARLKETRKPQAAAVGDDVLGQYERLLKRQGVPLVKVENEICGNCHLKLTPQTANEARKGRHVACDNCGHLLYAEE